MLGLTAVAACTATCDEYLQLRDKLAQFVAEKSSVRGHKRTLRKVDIASDMRVPATQPMRSARPPLSFSQQACALSHPFASRQLGPL
eukprot:297588-Pleurochrysis_carterae.AAC.1